jgi:hypothetical protein
MTLSDLVTPLFMAEMPHSGSSTNSCSSLTWVETLPMTRPFRSEISLKSTCTNDPKATALLGMLMEYSILFGQMFSTDYYSVSEGDARFADIPYHSMGEFQGT